ELPKLGYLKGVNGYVAPALDGTKVQVEINPESKRLQRLFPFEHPDYQKDFKDMHVLLKAKGKCTTDHISMAGPWLRFRGHIDNISNNMFIGAVNWFNDKTNHVKNLLTGKHDEVPNVARYYKANNIPWVVVGEENYGEGSSREHAAMEPRHLGGKAIIVKSFARIHETNLKKQGMLPLTFCNPEDYDKIKEDDKIDLDVKDIAPGSEVKMTLKHSDGTTEEVKLNHTMNEQQINWFKVGSALNLMAKKKEG
ncbi:MAG: aconitate hydratase, partial [Ignavibacteria bacterium]|nr:aconitate hydratase [Ignavibacteria bacterium]